MDVYIFIDTCIYIYIYKHIYVCACMLMYAHTPLITYVCMCLCAWTSICRSWRRLQSRKRQAVAVSWRKHRLLSWAMFIQIRQGLRHDSHRFTRSLSKSAIAAAIVIHSDRFPENDPVLSCLWIQHQNAFICKYTYRFNDNLVKSQQNLPLMNPRRHA